MASKKKDPHEAFDALLEALFAADEGRSFEDDILDLEDAFNRVMEKL